MVCVSYETTFCSTSFNWTKKWDQYDQIKQKWDQQGYADLSGVTKTGRTYNMMLRPDGTAIVTIDGGSELENRDYLKNASRLWNPQTDVTIKQRTYGAPDDSYLPEDVQPAAMDDGSMTALMTDVYPYCDPVINDDGTMILYLSDNGDPDKLQSSVSFAVKSENGYDNRGAVENTGMQDGAECDQLPYL